MNDTPTNIRNFRNDIWVFGELIRRAAAVIILPKAVAIMGRIASECRKTLYGYLINLIPVWNTRIK